MRIPASQPEIRPDRAAALSDINITPPEQDIQEDVRLKFHPEMARIKRT
jgi:hypothetical protein